MTLKPVRSVRSKHRGSLHGPITRLISPSDLGEQLKPFVFLDFFNAQVQRGFGFGMHPHSGIATLTWQPRCDVRYEDTTGQNGVLKAGGLEWMNAGGGAWHQGSFETQGLATGFQLWVAMPPGVEDGPSLGQYVPPNEVPQRAMEGVGLTLLLGQLELGDSPLTSSLASAISTHQDMNYFVLDLAANTTWSYTPPAEHDVAWAFVFEGSANVLGSHSARELLVLEGEGAITLGSGDAPARILIGSARQHPHALVLGSSSVHTSDEALRKGQARIRAIGENLLLQGKLQR